MTGLFARLWRDEEGVILPYITVLLVVFIGVAALALDGTRAMSLQTQMQKAADALAIAGAAELDRLTTSTGRAYNAVVTNAMLTNSSLFSGGVVVQNVRFLAELPAQDNLSVTALCSNNACTALQSTSARYIEVTVTPITLPAILPIRYVNQALGNLGAGASAIAGMDQVSCGLTPMFICNPFEQSGDTYDVATSRLETANNDPSLKRKLIRLASPAGPSAIWGPGDFGYLVPEPGTLPTDSCFPNAGDEIGKAMAMDRPLVCVRQNGVDLLTGNPNAAKDGLNTRFGIYANGPLTNNAACKTTYPPDKNVKKAWEPQAGDWCKPDKNYGNDNSNPPVWPPGTNSASFGVDDCLLGNRVCAPQGNIGADSWDCEAYWAAAHPGISLPGQLSGCTATATVSRYQVYEYETNTEPARLADPSPPFNETGSPNACTGTTTGTAQRRELYVAIVNCKALESTPNPVRSNATNIPVAAFGKFFLTHPTTNQTKPYAEFMGLVDRGSNVVRDQVQLYR